ncbi:MAG: T9SS type A sorting domain-containing protein, partial [Actinomycetota bacterium]|nr:T9SS type A sorting domain-containing protein [Actinomycetota bacterium]
SSVYGIAGGLAQPTIFTAEPGEVIQTGLIQFADERPWCYERTGTPVLDDGRMLYPVMNGFFVYNFDTVNWLYQQGDYLYLKKHERVIWGDNLVFNMPVGTIWNKIHNLSHGDSWTRTEIIDHQGTQLLTQIDFYALIDCHQGARNWYVQKDYQDNIISQTLTSLDVQLLFNHSPNGFLQTKEDILGSVANFDLAEGVSWKYIPVFAPEGPSYLSYDPTFEWMNPRIVTLYWQAPAQGPFGYQWTHYRIYINNAVFAEIPFSQCSLLLDSLDLHTFYVLYLTATDGVNESYPSNSIFFVGVANDDNVAQPLALRIYPNPFNAAQGISVELKNSGVGVSQISIYNARGQLVNSHRAEHKGAFQ